MLNNNNNERERESKKLTQAQRASDELQHNQQRSNLHPENER